MAARSTLRSWGTVCRLGSSMASLHGAQQPTCWSQWVQAWAHGPLISPPQYIECCAAWTLCKCCCSSRKAGKGPVHSQNQEARQDTCQSVPSGLLTHGKTGATAVQTPAMHECRACLRLDGLNDVHQDATTKVGWLYSATVGFATMPAPKTTSGGPAICTRRCQCRSA